LQKKLHRGKNSKTPGRKADSATNFRINESEGDLVKTTAAIKNTSRAKKSLRPDTTLALPPFVGALTW